MPSTELVDNLTEHTTSESGKVLQDVFGYQHFRPGQQEAIEKVLQGKDSLVIMPTGGGKSLCYQVPALIFAGVTICLLYTSPSPRD